jgi:trk system potassium uptake protein TrkA
MKIIIVGGGKLAYYLIKTLKPHRHDITLIELQKDLCDRIATDFDEVNVYNGDGTNIHVLTAVGCDQADFYVAVTGKDENNLVGCEVAKMRFGVRVTVARVNNPKNLEMFDRLGVNKVFSSTQILADIIEQEIDFAGMRIVFSIPNTSKAIIEFQLAPQSAACNKTLQQYQFPGDSKVVMITHNDGRVEMPHGNQVMHANDIMLLVSDESEFNNIWKTMVRR